MRRQRCTNRTTSSVTVSLDVSKQHVESSWLSLWNPFHHNPWQCESSSFFVSFDFLCQQHHLTSHHHLPRRATQAVPVVRHDGQHRFDESCGLHMNKHHLLQFYGIKLSLQVAPLASTSVVQFVSVRSFFPSLPNLILFMTYAAKRGSQLCGGLPSAMRTPVFCSAKSGGFCIVVSLLAQPFLLDRWPCDHPQVFFVESLPPRTCLNHCILK